MKGTLLLLISFFSITSFVSHPEPTAEVGLINWMSWEEAIEAHKITPKKIFIDVYTDWCGYCKKMDKTTFTNTDVINTINENFYAVKFNAEQKEVIKFNDAEFKFANYGRRGAHELAYTLLDKRLAYPSFVYLDEQLRKIMPSPGYKQVPQLMQELSYIHTDSYKEMSLADYAKRAE
jgi:thioredoxin-related protein